MQRAAHATAERIIDQLMLAHTCQPPKLGRSHNRSIMVPVPGKIGQLDAGTRQSGENRRFNIFSSHRHGSAARDLQGSDIALLDKFYAYGRFINPDRRQISYQFANDILVPGLFQI